MIITILSLFLFRSPFMIAPIITLLIFNLNINKFSITKIFLIISIILFIPFVVNIFVDRFSMGIASDGSTYTRIIRPLYLTYLSTKSSIFGVGLLNNEFLLDLYLKETGDTLFYWKTIDGNIYILNNFSAHFAYFGLFGGTILSYVLIKMFNTLTTLKTIFINFI